MNIGAAPSYCESVAAWVAECLYLLDIFAHVIVTFDDRYSSDLTVRLRNPETSSEECKTQDIRIIVALASLPSTLRVHHVLYRRQAPQQRYFHRGVSALKSRHERDKVWSILDLALSLSLSLSLSLFLL